MCAGVRFIAGVHEVVWIGAWARERGSRPPVSATMATTNPQPPHTLRFPPPRTVTPPRTSCLRDHTLLAAHRTHSADASSQPPSAPTLLYSLAHLEEQLKAAYKLVTEGKFTEALKVRLFSVVITLFYCFYGYFLWLFNMRPIDGLVGLSTGV